MSRKGNDAWRIVDNNFNARGTLKGFDVATLLADYFAFDFIRRNGNACGTDETELAKR